MSFASQNEASSFRFLKVGIVFLITLTPFLFSLVYILLALFSACLALLQHKIRIDFFVLVKRWSTIYYPLDPKQLLFANILA